MTANPAGPQQPVHLSSSQEIGHICKPDPDQAQHTDAGNKPQIVSSTEAKPKHATSYPKLLSLDPSAASHKIVHPVATRAQPKHPGSYSSAHGRTQHCRPVAFFSQSVMSDRSGLTNHKICQGSDSNNKLTLASSYLHLHHQLQANLAGAHAVGYCNGIRHTAADASLTFSQDDISFPLIPAAANNQPHVQQAQQHTLHSNVSAAEAVAASATQDKHASLPVLHDQPSIGQHQEQQALQLLHGEAQQEQGQDQQHLHGTHLPDHSQLGFVPHAAANHLEPTDQQSTSPPVMQSSVQSQAGSVPSNVDGSRKKRKCVMFTASKAMGNSLDKLVKFRCNIQDILDTSFPGCDASTAHTASSSSSAAATPQFVTTPIELPSAKSTVTHQGLTVVSKDLNAACTVSATSRAETSMPSTLSATQPALVRVPIPPLTTPSALLSTSSSANSHPDDVATLTEEEGRQAMPPPRGKRATAESVQAAVAAAQQEAWAMVAQAAAWGSFFPGVGHFAQLGPAAGSIASPEQVSATQGPNNCWGGRGRGGGGCPATTYLPQPSYSVAAKSSNPRPLSLPLLSQYPLEAILPCPHPQGPSNCPYVLSSLPQVMHQLQEEPRNNFLQSQSLPAAANVPSQFSDLGTKQLPAKKQCKDRRQLPTLQQGSTVGDHPQQTASDQGAVAQQHASGQQSVERQSGVVDMDASGWHQADQQPSDSQQKPRDWNRGLQPTVTAELQDKHAAEARPTPQQLTKHEAGQRVAKAIAPEEDGCRHAGMPH